MGFFALLIWPSADRQHMFAVAQMHRGVNYFAIKSTQARRHNTTTRLRWSREKYAYMITCNKRFLDKEQQANCCHGSKYQILKTYCKKRNSVCINSTTFECEPVHWFSLPSGSLSLFHPFHCMYASRSVRVCIFCDSSVVKQDLRSVRRSLIVHHHNASRLPLLLLLRKSFRFILLRISAHCSFVPRYSTRSFI